MTKNWHNGGLLCMYCSGERVPDFANAKSRVLVKGGAIHWYSHSRILVGGVLGGMDY